MNPEGLTPEDRQRINDALAREQQKKRTGLYQKYNVTRTDGSSEPGGKHHGCRYFVLDLDCDKHAKAALAAYAHSCQDEFPVLAKELLDDLFRGMHHRLDAIAKGESMI